MAMTTPTSYSWLKDYLGEIDLSSQEVADLLGMHAFEIEEVRKVKDEDVIDVDILPNRSSDCLCHRGIAREVATLTNISLVNDPLSSSPDLKETDLIEIKIEDSNACPRFTASLITDIEVKESPDWLKKRLEAIGQRPINNIVDATNYVMFSVGQPIHAYDAGLFPQVDGKWQFGVRYAKEDEVVSLIAEGGKNSNQNEERDVVLKGTELLIIDRSSNTPIGLAGVKGGRFAGVHEKTTKVIIEAAHFHPTVTRKTARRLGIVIDASKRFENEPSRELPPYGQSEIIKLILDIAGGTYEGTIDEYLEKVELPKVNVSVNRTNALLGIALSSEEMLDILNRVGCKVTCSDDTLTAIGPWERTDLAIEEDFIEEIGRIYGYEHVDSVVPETVPLAEINVRHYYSEKIRTVLIAEGFSEVITSSFRKKDVIKLRNALASDKEYLRSSLIKNITESLDQNIHNLDLLGLQDIRIFEIGTVFKKGEGSVHEHVSLALGVRGKQQGYSPKDDTALEEAIHKLTEALDSAVNCTIDKGVVEINITELLKKLPAPIEYEKIEVGAEIQYRPFSTFPFIARDVSLWASEETLADEVESVLNDVTGSLRVRTTLFDEFSKDGRTSYAFRLVFQSYNKTLTDDEVNVIMDQITSAISERGWEMR